jgi:hypothetical protein
MQGTSDPTHVELLDAAAHCRHLVPNGSVHAFLADHRRHLFPDELFADLFPASRGRPSVPADVIATVMVLQALEGLSDRDATRQLACNIAWKVACGLALTDPGFHPSVLTLWRARLRASDRPERIFRGGPPGHRHDRGPHRADPPRACLHPARRRGRHPRHRHPAGGRDPPGAPTAAPSGRAAACRPRLQPAGQAGRRVGRPGRTPAVGQRAGHRRVGGAGRRAGPGGRAAGVVAGQDVEPDQQPGSYRIARKVAPDRVISVVDPDARPMHKSVSSYRDGYKMECGGTSPAQP